MSELNPLKEIKFRTVWRNKRNGALAFVYHKVEKGSLSSFGGSLKNCNFVSQDLFLFNIKQVFEGEFIKRYTTGIYENDIIKDSKNPDSEPMILERSKWNTHKYFYFFGQEIIGKPEDIVKVGTKYDNQFACLKLVGGK